MANDNEIRWRLAMLVEGKRLPLAVVIAAITAIAGGSSIGVFSGDGADVKESLAGVESTLRECRKSEDRLARQVGTCQAYVEKVHPTIEALRPEERAEIRGGYPFPDEIPFIFTIGPSEELK